MDRTPPINYASRVCESTVCRVYVCVIVVVVKFEGRLDTTRGSLRNFFRVCRLVVRMFKGTNSAVCDSRMRQIIVNDDSWRFSKKTNFCNRVAYERVYTDERIREWGVYNFPRITLVRIRECVKETHTEEHF